MLTAKIIILGPSAMYTVKSLVGFTLFTLIASSSIQAGTLDVEVNGFTQEEGLARILLMSSKERYQGSQAIARDVSVPIKAGMAQWTAADLPAGDYAIIAHHDRNANNELDRPVFGLPIEPYGYSKGAWTSVVLPRWDAVKFTVGDPLERQTIRLRTNVFATAGKLLAIIVMALVVSLGGLILIRFLRRRRVKTAG